MKLPKFKIPWGILGALFLPTILMWGIWGELHSWRLCVTIAILWLSTWATALLAGKNTAGNLQTAKQLERVLDLILGAK